MQAPWVPSLLGLFPYGSEDTSYQYASVLPVPGASHALLESQGSCGFHGASWASAVGGLEARRFASAERMVTHRNKFLCAFSFAIFRLISYAKLFAHPLPNVFSLYE